MASGSCDNVEHCDGTATSGKGKSGPSLFYFAKLHVGELDLSTSKTLFEVEIETDEGEKNGDGLGVFIDGLGGESVHDILMNKLWARVRESVVGELIVGGLGGG